MTVITAELLRAYFLGFISASFVAIVVAFAWFVYKEKMEKLDRKIERLEEKK